MTRNAYRAARHGYRAACFADRQADSAARNLEDLRDGMPRQLLPARTRQSAFLLTLAPREQLAVTSRPYRAFSRDGGLPWGPRTEALYRRQNSREAVLAKALAQAAALDAPHAFRGQVAA